MLIENWQTLSEEKSAEIESRIKNIEPMETSCSLHVYEERYEVDGDIYRVLEGIGGEGRWIEKFDPINRNSVSRVTELTGKAKEDFEKWFSIYSEKWHNLRGWCDYDRYIDEVELPETLLNCLIIEWLDTVDIFISVNKKYSWAKQKLVYIPIVDDTYLGFECDTRNEAYQKAINSISSAYQCKVK